MEKMFFPFSLSVAEMSSPSLHLKRWTAVDAFPSHLNALNSVRQAVISEGKLYLDCECSAFEHCP